MILPSIKLCTKCNKCLTIDCFHVNNSREIGSHPSCKLCVSEDRKQSRLNNPGAEWKRIRDWKYNLPPGKYEEMLEEQGGVCAICHQPETVRNNALSVDHDRACCPGDRSCGECVRGLLCFKCNVHIVLFESKEWVQSALEYLLNKGV